MRSRAGIAWLALTLAACLASQGCKSLSGREVENFALAKQSEAPVAPPTPLRTDRYSEHELCVTTAESLAAKGHATEAIKLYEKAEKLDTKKGPFDLELAPLFTQVGQPQKAIERYRRVIATGEATAEVYNNLAWTLNESGQPAEALRVLKRALAAEPDDRRLQTTEAIVFYQLGRRDEAFSRFRDLYGVSAAHHNLAVLDVDAGQANAAEEQARLAAQAPDSTLATREFHKALQTHLK